jgi:hypothetical protein
MAAEGDNEDNKYYAVIATHQGRLQCMLDKITGHNYTLDGKVIHKFKNGAVLRVQITKNNISVKLVYDGELDENEGKGKHYFVTNNGVMDNLPAKSRPIPDQSTSEEFAELNEEEKRRLAYLESIQNQSQLLPEGLTMEKVEKLIQKYKAQQNKELLIRSSAYAKDAGDDTFVFF